MNRDPNSTFSRLISSFQKANTLSENGTSDPSPNKIRDFNNGWFQGWVRGGGARYRLRPILSVPGLISVEKADPSLRQPFDPSGSVDLTGGPEWVQRQEQSFFGNSEIRRLLLYSDSAKSGLGGTVDPFANDSEDFMNDAFAFNQQPYRIKTAGVVRYPGGLIPTTLMEARDYQDEAGNFVVRDLREGFGADYVEFLANSGDPIVEPGGNLFGNCGRTTFLGTNAVGQEYAIAFIGVSLSPGSVACGDFGETSLHELGHNLGACHERGASPTLRRIRNQVPSSPVGLMTARQRTRRFQNKRPSI